MKNFFSLIAVLSLVPAASAAVRIEGVALDSDRVASSQGLSAELVFNADGSRLLARLSRCREYVFDWPQSCEDQTLFSSPDLLIDQTTRTITLQGEVVARISRIGRFIRLEPSFRLKHEVTVLADSSGIVRRAKLYLERVDG